MRPRWLYPTIMVHVLGLEGNVLHTVHCRIIGSATFELNIRRDANTVNIISQWGYVLGLCD